MTGVAPQREGEADTEIDIIGNLALTRQIGRPAGEGCQPHRGGIAEELGAVVELRYLQLVELVLRVGGRDLLAQAHGVDGDGLGLQPDKRLARRHGVLGIELGELELQLHLLVHDVEELGAGDTVLLKHHLVGFVEDVEVADVAEHDAGDDMVPVLLQGVGPRIHVGTAVVKALARTGDVGTEADVALFIATVIELAVDPVPPYLSLHLGLIDGHGVVVIGGEEVRHLPVQTPIDLARELQTGVTLQGEHVQASLYMVEAVAEGVATGEAEEGSLRHDIRDGVEDDTLHETETATEVAQHAVVLEILIDKHLGTVAVCLKRI